MRQNSRVLKCNRDLGSAVTEASLGVKDTQRREGQHLRGEERRPPSSFWGVGKVHLLLCMAGGELYGRAQQHEVAWRMWTVRDKQVWSRHPVLEPRSHRGARELAGALN